MGGVLPSVAAFLRGVRREGKRVGIVAILRLDRQYRRLSTFGVNIILSLQHIELKDPCRKKKQTRKSQRHTLMNCTL